MKTVIPPEIWQALMLGAVSIIAAGVAWVVEVLRRMAREQRARANDNEKRDAERNELVQNVRRLVNGSATINDTSHLSPGAHRLRSDRRLGPRRAVEIHPTPAERMESAIEDDIEQGENESRE